MTLLPNLAHLNQQPLGFTLCQEKISGHGEDAEPIKYTFPSADSGAGILAVFDGLGGAGSERYRDANHTDHTGAKLAARCVRTSVQQFCSALSTKVTTPTFAINANILNKLKQDMITALNSELSKYTFTQSRIRSSMRRTLPTTMASVFYFPNQQQCQCSVVWAGDSRVFALTPIGLQQLSRDDVQTSTDNSEFEVLVDAPITNCIQSNGNFQLHNFSYSYDLPVILIAATDGCFNCVATPGHFEQLLFTTLYQSNTLDEWRDHITAALQQIAQDDFSMAVVCLGWTDFAAIKYAFIIRSMKLTYMLMTDPQSTATHNSIDNRTVLQAFWRTYRITYEAKLQEHAHGR
jgi:serine/threonine protein phosphatase PrpC